MLCSAMNTANDSKRRQQQAERGADVLHIRLKCLTALAELEVLQKRLSIHGTATPLHIIGEHIAVSSLH